MWLGKLSDLLICFKSNLLKYSAFQYSLLSSKPPYIYLLVVVIFEQVAITPLSLSPYIEADTQTAPSSWISSTLQADQ